MSLLSVVQGVCATVGVQVPTSVFTNITYNRTMTEMLELATEMAQRIAGDTRDWTRLRTTQTYTGDGAWVPPPLPGQPPDPTAVFQGTTAFDLPANFKRMLLTANVWRSTSQLTPMTFVPDTDEWLNRRSRNFYNSFGEWTLLNNQIHIQPVMGAGVSAYFPYLDKNCITFASGGVGERFMADADSFLLGDRLLKLGMIWQWKAQKGSPYSEDLSNYGDALTYAMGHDSPGPIIIGRRPISANARVAYPFGPVPTP